MIKPYRKHSADRGWAAVAYASTDPAVAAVEFFLRAGVDPMTRDESAHELARSSVRRIRFVLSWMEGRVIMGASSGLG